MAPSGTTVTRRSAGALAGVITSGADALADFPSEQLVAAVQKTRGQAALRRPPGVTIIVAPISRGVAAGLIAILLAGVTGAAAIGMLADDVGLLPPPSSWFSARR